MSTETPRLNPLSLHVYTTDFFRFILPDSVKSRVERMKWRKNQPWCPDRRHKGARAWLRYETRVKAFAEAEYLAGRNPTHAPEWDTELDGP
jgi:hypothetical protein